MFVSGFAKRRHEPQCYENVEERGFLFQLTKYNIVYFYKKKRIPNIFYTRIDMSFELMHCIDMGRTHGYLLKTIKKLQFHKKASL